MEFVSVENVAPSTLKLVAKEGGKRAAELEMSQAMGGLNYFCNCLDMPQGELPLLFHAVVSMNAEVPEDAEERCGGSGHIAKMMLSFAPDSIAVVCYVPEDLKSECNAEEWLQHVLKGFNGKKVHEAEGLLLAIIEQKEALSIKTAVITCSLDFLRERNLIPALEDDDDSDDVLYGEDVFDE